MNYMIDPEHTIVLSRINTYKNAIPQVITYTQETLIRIVET